jgi:hypothetical protein
MQIDQSAHASTLRMFVSHLRTRRWHGLRLRQIDLSAHMLGYEAQRMLRLTCVLAEGVVSDTEVAGSVCVGGGK